jgi:hypothetical protein
MAVDSVDPQDPRPTDPFRFSSFTVYSPPAVPDTTGVLVGGKVLVQGTVTLTLQATPFDASDPGQAGSLWWYLGTHTERWPGGQLLPPAPKSLLLFAGGDAIALFPPFGTAPYDVQDCFLFRPTSKDQCKNGGWRTFGMFKNQGDCVSFVRKQARRGCSEERGTIGWGAFRAKFGSGKHQRAPSESGGTGRPM